MFGSIDFWSQAIVAVADYILAATYFLSTLVTVKIGNIGVIKNVVWSFLVLFIVTIVGFCVYFSIICSRFLIQMDPVKVFCTITDKNYVASEQDYKIYRRVLACDSVVLVMMTFVVFYFIFSIVRIVIHIR